MDNRKYVVFIKNKNRTDDIESCTLKNGIYNIFFKNSKQLYLYNTNQVKFYKIVDIKETDTEDIIITYDNAYKSGKIYSLVELHSSENAEMFVGNKKSYLSHFNIFKPTSVIDDFSNKIVRRNGNIFAEIKTIYVYNDFYKVIFKAGLSKIYEKSTLSISEQVNNLPVINYFKDISNDLRSYSPVYTYLSDMYNSIMVDNSSIFYNYINKPKIIESRNTLDYIYPFNFEKNQMIAIKNAFSYNMSFIENSDHVGKIYTIINIISNAIINNKTICIVSNNNEFLKEIKSTLENYDLGFLFAFLDTSESADYFFEHQPIIPNISNWQRTLKEQNTLKKELEYLELIINKCFKYKDELEQIKFELYNLSSEFDVFKNTFSEYDINFKNFTLLNLSQLNNLLVDLYNYFNNTNLSIYNRIRLLWKYDFLDFKSLKNHKKELELSIQKNIYIKKINKLQDGVNDLTSKLSNNNFENNMKIYLDKAMELFKSYLYARYYEMVNTSFLFSNYKNNFYSFIKKYPVILSNPYAIQSNIKTNYMFDYAIFDDASNIGLLEAGITLACAKSAIIFGDLNNQSNTVDKSISYKSNNILNTYKLSHFYNVSENNILKSIKDLYVNLPTVKINEKKEYVDYKNSTTNIKPVFPLLMKDFSNSLLNTFLLQFKSNSFINEEKLAHNEIINVLSDKNYKHFDWIFGLSIGNIIKNMDMLSLAEKDFVNGSYFETHFVIYRKSNNMPVLVIDVDNFTLHKDIKEFTIRDIRSFKLNILKKYGIKYLYWNMHGYGDPIELINTLDKIK